VPYSVSVLEAVRAGQRSIEHEDDLMRACTLDDADLRRELAAPHEDATPAAELALVSTHARRIREGYDQPRCTAVLAEMARAGVRLTPTLAVYQPYIARGDTAVMHPSVLRLVPARLQAEWRARLGRTTPGDSAVVAAFFSLPITAEAHRLGVRVMAGTDAPLAYVLPGLALHDELALLVRAGLTPMQAIRAATYEPAAYLGALDSLGTIRPGRAADACAHGGAHRASDDRAGGSAGRSAGRCAAALRQGKGGSSHQAGRQDKLQMHAHIHSPSIDVDQEGDRCRNNGLRAGPVSPWPCPSPAKLSACCAEEQDRGDNVTPSLRGRGGLCFVRARLQRSKEWPIWR